jgi:hypothetical protein
MGREIIQKNDMECYHCGDNRFVVKKRNFAEKVFSEINLRDYVLITIATIVATVVQTGMALTLDLFWQVAITTLAVSFLVFIILSILATFK